MPVAPASRSRFVMYIASRNQARWRLGTLTRMSAVSGARFWVHSVTLANARVAAMG
jgi:hypothetical protein